MLVSRRHRIVIATPTKCATYTIQDALRKKQKWEFVRPQHRMDVPDEFSKYTRVMMMRNPYDRLVSVYHFLHYKASTQWGHREVQEMTFGEFVRWFGRKYEDSATLDPTARTHRSPGLWTNSLWDNAQVFNPVFLFDITTGRGQADMSEWLSQQFNVKIDRFVHANKTPNTERKERRWEPYFRGRIIRAIANEIWCDQDCREFGYPKLED